MLGITICTQIRIAKSFLIGTAGYKAESSKSYNIMDILCVQGLIKFVSTVYETCIVA